MKTENNKHLTTVGGQALIEGLMMIGPKNVSIAVRKPDGEIAVENRPPFKKGFFSKMPFVRGSVLLFKQLVMGIRALMISAEYVDIEGDEGVEPSKLDLWLERTFGDKLKNIVIITSVIISIFLSVGLFILLPNIIATVGMLPFDEHAMSSFKSEFTHLNLSSIKEYILHPTKIISSLKGTLSLGGNTLATVMYNLIEGIVRVIIFFLYILFASKISPEIKRVWQYHGAEHKTIHCYENGEELTVENIKKYPTMHPRCGTSFLFTVMIVSIIVFSVFKWQGLIFNVLLRLLLVPVVAGISYELFKIAGKSCNKLWGLFKAPGIAFQKFTTAEPDDQMIEVAIVAMKNALTENKEDDKW